LFLDYCAERKLVKLLRGEDAPEENAGKEEKNG
jgi:hypothetical protein